MSGINVQLPTDLLNTIHQALELSKFWAGLITGIVGMLVIILLTERNRK